MARVGKDTKRCCDYRKALLSILHAMQKNEVDGDLVELFSTAAEIQELLYAKEIKQNDMNILRLHNVTFRHAMLCNKIFPKDSDTNNRLYLSYFHALTCHAPLCYRMVCLRSLNTECEERLFNQAKNITRTTSNMHPGHIIKNILTRIQEERRIASKCDPLQFEESTITKLASVLDKAPNTFFHNQWINDHHHQFQAHLERISDYLLQGPGKWRLKMQDGVEFLDKGTSKEVKLLVHNHFRSNTLLNVTIELQKC